MRHDADGRVVEVGARTRTIPPALRRALQHRDKTCRFPGCNVRIAEGHHVRHWAHGGPTKLSNLALLCRRHHRAVHEEGYRSRFIPARGSRSGTGNGWTSVGGSICGIRGRGDPFDEVAGRSSVDSHRGECDRRSIGRRNGRRD
jgi:hypothetical protein